MEIPIYTKIINDQHIIVTISQISVENKQCYVKIGNKWSFNKIKDIGRIIIAFETDDLDWIKGTYSANAIFHDLYDAELISKEEWERLRD